jgi:hypothetical protein
MGNKELEEGKFLKLYTKSRGVKMACQNYRKTVEQLREFASIFWPSDLSQEEAKLSILPKLLETQEQFIAILIFGMKKITLINLLSCLVEVNSQIINLVLMAKNCLSISPYLCYIRML